MATAELQGMHGRLGRLQRLPRAAGRPRQRRAVRLACLSLAALALALAATYSPLLTLAAVQSAAQPEVELAAGPAAQDIAGHAAGSAPGEGLLLAEATATALPTLTPQPTHTPPAATATSLPTATPQPTATPPPTATPLPTATATAVPPTRIPPTATPTPTAAAPAAPRPPAGGPPTRIEAPAIGLAAPVVVMGYRIVYIGGVAATDWQVPDNDAAFHQGSAYPGHPGNTVVSGHNNIGREVFRYLENLNVGDTITLYVGSTAYRYAVSQKEIVAEAGATLEQRVANARWIMPTADERLTLISCWPYTGNSHRIIVVALPAP